MRILRATIWLGNGFALCATTCHLIDEGRRVEDDFPHEAQATTWGFRARGEVLRFDDGLTGIHAVAWIVKLFCCCHLECHRLSIWGRCDAGA